MKKLIIYADIFWFSLFHEIAHIIYGHIGQANGTSDNDEKEADSFARETLIPSDELKFFVENSALNIDTLNKFAERIGVENLQEGGIKTIQKHVMRYQQMFAELKIKQMLDTRGKRGVIWHTQGNEKKACIFYGWMAMGDKNC